MDFSLTADQKLMQESLARALAEQVPLERVRAYAANPADEGAEVWRLLTEFGLPGLLIPEQFGGLGLSLLDAALAAEALGAAVTPGPFLGACALGPLALTLGGSPDQQRAWLPGIAAGEIVVGVAIAEPVAGARDGARVTATGDRLTGKSLFVIEADRADLFVVADRSGGLHLVRADAPGLTRASMTTIDLTRRLGELSFADTPSEPLGDVLTRLRDAAWTLIAADALGAGGTMIDKAVAYAQERRQFGRVIGSFQAVKHLCAEMAAELEPARSLVWYAAYAFEAVPDEASLTAAHAKAHLSEIGRFIARSATEIHGGMGITDLLGLHYWFKRLGLDRQLLGGPERVRRLAAQMQGLAA